VETILLVTQSDMTKPFVIPLSLLILDLLGLAIVGLGVAEQVGRIHIVPEHLRFTGWVWSIMLLGCVVYVAFSVSNFENIETRQARRKCMA
jgi:Ca2+/Na+ antiporter